MGGLGGIPVEALHKVCLEVQGDPGVLGNLPGHLALVQGKAASTSRLKKEKVEYGGIPTHFVACYPRKVVGNWRVRWPHLVLVLVRPADECLAIQ